MRFRLFVILSSIALGLLVLLPVFAPVAAPSWAPSSSLRWGYPLSGGIEMVVRMDKEAAVSERVRQDVIWLRWSGEEFADSARVVDVQQIWADEIKIVSPDSSADVGALLSAQLGDYTHQRSSGEEHFFRLSADARAEFESSAERASLRHLQEATFEMCDVTIEPERLPGDRFRLWLPTDLCGPNGSDGDE